MRTMISRNADMLTTRQYWPGQRVLVRRLQEHSPDEPILLRPYVLRNDVIGEVIFQVSNQVPVIVVIGMARDNREVLALPAHADAGKVPRALDVILRAAVRRRLWIQKALPAA